MNHHRCVGNDGWSCDQLVALDCSAIAESKSFGDGLLGDQVAEADGVQLLQVVVGSMSAGGASCGGGVDDAMVEIGDLEHGVGFEDVLGDANPVILLVVLLVVVHLVDMLSLRAFSAAFLRRDDDGLG